MLRCKDCGWFGERSELVGKGDCISPFVWNQVETACCPKCGGETFEYCDPDTERDLARESAWK